jgi:hypothetical protein
VNRFSSRVAIRENAQPRPTAAFRARWRDVRHQQLEMHSALAGEGMRFVAWLVLESLFELIQETGDSVSQAMVAERAGLSKVVTSHWLIRMEMDELLDRGVGEDERTNSVLITILGEEVLERCSACLAAVGLPTNNGG